MLIDSVAVLLAIFGVVLGYFLYIKQRNDNSKDAHKFFKSSLPELKTSILSALKDLEEFKQSLDLDNLINPILSATLNDKFLQKINLVHLSRFYKKYQPENSESFHQFLVDSNFFGDYHAYISKEINFFQTNYLERKKEYHKWQRLRTTHFFSKKTIDAVNTEYEDFYTQWVNQLNKKLSISKSHEMGIPTKLKNHKPLIDHLKKLNLGILPYIGVNHNAAEAYVLSHKILDAHTDLTLMKSQIKNVIEKDIEKFEKVLANLNQLLDDTIVSNVS